MFEGKKIAAVVPAFNEAAHIGRVIGGIPSLVDLIIVIDDASQDGTSAAASSIGDERVVVLRHSKKTGVGGAVLDGYATALQREVDITVVMAGDDQMDPVYLPELLGPIAGGSADVTKGNRFFSPDSFRGMPRLRILGNIVLSFLTKAASGYWHVFDPQNGYVASSADVLRKIDATHIASSYAFENDMLVALSIVGARVRDVSIPARYGSEVSTLRLWRDGFRILRVLCRGFFRRVVWKYVVSSFSPIALLLVMGAVLCVFGIAVGIWAMIMAANVVPSAATVMLAALPFILGTQMLLFAMMLDINEEPK